MLLNLTHAIGFGIVTASILAIATVALTMQYSVTNVPNFAQGDIMTAGAFGAYTTQFVVSNFLVAALVAMAVGAAISFFLNWALLQPFARRGAKPLILFVVTIGFAFVLENAMLAIFGGSPVLYKLGDSPPNQIGPFLLTGRDLVIILVAIVSLSSVHIVLKYTKFGKAQRAVADSTDLALVSGIDAGRVVHLTMIWAGALTGLAGYILAAQVGAFDHSLGFTFLLVVFAAAVVGGIGQVNGAMLGALLIGIGMEVAALYIAPDYKQSVAFLALVITILFRPDGIIPSPSRRAVQL
ncbi:MAG: branched-chain amino acid ABC transporter permease [Candidatus Dormibacteraeota bacterium]|nr:branched-chain amino acid ABC transporter permease [Candidatus Dormibacteraeota bacterium]